VSKLFILEPQKYASCTERHLRNLHTRTSVIQRTSCLYFYDISVLSLSSWIVALDRDDGKVIGLFPSEYCNYVSAELCDELVLTSVTQRVKFKLVGVWRWSLTLLSLLPLTLRWPTLTCSHNTELLIARVKKQRDIPGALCKMTQQIKHSEPAFDQHDFPSITFLSFEWFYVQYWNYSDLIINYESYDSRSVVFCLWNGLIE